MNHIVIEADHLAKRYRIGRRPRYRTLRESLVEAAQSPVRIWQKGRRGKTFFWALHDVSFQVAAGEVVGVIGRNGAGKTTLLKLLSRITRPTSGRARIQGRVGSLLEVGTGFHPELTGRENIQLSAAILGMTRREVEKRFDAIVDFAGIGSFLDTQLKHYSSGMQTRLGFAVAAHLDPDILFIDEVLAVGDLEFQRKCLGKMGEVARGGRTVVFVSHHMNQIRSLCGRCIWLDRGSIRTEGDTQTVVAAYEAAVLSGQVPVSESKKVQIFQWEVVDSEGHQEHRIERPGPVTFCFHAFLPEPVARGILGIHLSDELGRVIWHLDWSFSNMGPGPCLFQLRFPYLPVRPGAYVWRAAICDGGRWSELYNLMPPFIVSTQPIAYTQGNFHSVLDLPYELEAHPDASNAAGSASDRSPFSAVEKS